MNFKIYLFKKWRNYLLDSFFLLISFATIPCKNLLSMAERPVAIIRSDNEKDLFFAISKLNDNGGVIYINTPIININRFSMFHLSGTKPGGIVGMRQSNGAYPRINFKNARNNGIKPNSFTISGSNQYMKYLIIEHGGIKGIWIHGSNNTLDHIITRYNSGDGIYISDKSSGNVLNYCYSYRNFNTRTSGSSTNGLVGTSNTVFNYCFAWDNSGNGLSLSYNKGDNSANVQYLHSACWNNGNPDVFTGEYDFNLGKSLDKNMWTIQQIIESDPSFETNYSQRRFRIVKEKLKK